jgi:glycosyltransferase involved in cell wall biosynthesis
VLYLGRLADHKGVDDLVKAAALLRDAGVRFSVTIAGAGEERGRLEALIRSESLSNLVTMPGPVFGQAKDELWRTADVFVMPTRAKEGMPYSLLEAMSAGAVPVACCQGGMADAMQEGINSLAVPTHDPGAIAAAITRLSGDRELLARLARAGRQRIVEEFSVARLARDFSALYSRVLSGIAISTESA